MVKKNNYKYYSWFFNNFFAMTIIFTSVFTENIIIAQTNSKIQTISYHGIRPSDPGGRNGLLNPERGFRYDSYIGLTPGDKMWDISSYLNGKATRGISDDWFLMNARRFKADGMTLIQAYCYLTEFYDKPISEEKLVLLQQSLDRCREAGFKFLLRFSYSINMRREQGPTVETILGHIEQLAPIIQRNKDVIYVLQAGFVGAWGEWHSSANYIEEDHSGLAAIIKKELQILPRDRMIQIRMMPKYKQRVLRDPILNSNEILDSSNAFTGIPVARLGFANDGFMADKDDGGTWSEPPFYANPGNPKFDIETKESPYMAVDGELYWSDEGGRIEGLQAALRLRLHHYTSFSITHSYSDYEGGHFSMDRWMETPLNLEQVKKVNLPISDGYFQNYAGKSVERTEFEYIRDHLGYRIELQSAKFEKDLSKNELLDVEVELINRGFSTIINPRPLYLVMINTSGELVLKQRTLVNPQTWQPYKPGDLNYKPLVHSIKTEISLKHLKVGEYMLGLWIPDADESIQEDSRYAIHVANRDSPWWTTADGKFGVNILGTVNISTK